MSGCPSNGNVLLRTWQKVQVTPSLYHSMSAELVFSLAKFQMPVVRMQGNSQLNPWMLRLPSQCVSANHMSPVTLSFGLTIALSFGLTIMCHFTQQSLMRCHARMIKCLMQICKIDGCIDELLKHLVLFLKDIT